jgi:hypothetical protein
MQHSEQKIGLSVLISEKRNPYPLSPNNFDVSALSPNSGAMPLFRHSARLS